MTYDAKSITFLDVQIHRKLTGELCSTLPTHPKNTANTMLHADSFHPPSLKDSIPYGQYLSLQRNCSNEVLFKVEAGKLQNRLFEQGYSRFRLSKAHKRTIDQPHQELLFKHKTKNDMNSGGMRLII